MQQHQVVARMFNQSIIGRRSINGNSRKEKFRIAFNSIELKTMLLNKEKKYAHTWQQQQQKNVIIVFFEKLCAKLNKSAAVDMSAR